MDLQIHGTSKKVSVADQYFGCDYNEGLVHQAIVSHLAGARAGTKAQKTRSEVSGGGIKPWRQKGTGRARAGTIRSPIWRAGGRAFAAKPRSYKQKMNRAMYRRALATILSELVRQERLIVLEGLKLKEAKTRELAAELKKLAVSNALIITSEPDTNLFMAARNIPNMSVIDVAHIEPVSLVQHEKVIVLVDALPKIEERLQ